jgi:shikimate dehydrogenase
MIVGLIGHPVAHSQSPRMQQAAFAAVGLRDWRYELWDTPAEALAARLDDVRRRADIAGGNVTVPHKQAVLPFLDEVTADARAIGAVNTLFKHAGRLWGDNTDWVGFLADLDFHGVTVDAGTRALVLGAGGSARAVVYALRARGAQVWIYNRSFERAQALAEAFGREGCEPVETLAAPACRSATLVVNCTPVGMWPAVDASPWPRELPFPARAVLYDLIYRPPVTALIGQARAAGARAIGGAGMLAEQGAAAFARWTGIPAARVSTVMREALNHA